MVLIEMNTRMAAPIERCFDLARCIEVHLLGTEKTGEQAVGGVTTGLMGSGESVRWRAKHLGVWQHLESRITAFERPHYFQDTMVEGAFRYMKHDHFFVPLSSNTTEMKDRFEFAAPLPVLGKIAELVFLRRYMTQFLRERNAILKGIAESLRWMEFLKR